MQMNPKMQVLARMMRGNSPKDIVMSMLGSSAQNNPMLSNLLTLAQQGKGANIEDIARTMLKSQGFDFDKEFGEFREQLGI